MTIFKLYKLDCEWLSLMLIKEAVPPCNMSQESTPSCIILCLWLSKPKNIVILFYQSRYNIIEVNLFDCFLFLRSKNDPSSSLVNGLSPWFNSYSHISVPTMIFLKTKVSCDGPCRPNYSRYYSFYILTYLSLAEATPCIIRGRRMSERLVWS